MKQILLIFTALFMPVFIMAQQIDRSPNRVKTDLKLSYKQIGTLIPKSVKETHNHLTIGCETLDRDYTDYEKYKAYLDPLGIKKIRLQAGWAKTEKVKGIYDFSWLDLIINDAVDRGLKVWLETSYGNPIYDGGGTIFLSGGMPTSSEAKAAWNKWVEALATRYNDKVSEWEIWNEPNNNPEITFYDVAELNIRTAEIIKRIQPEAEIAALAMGMIDIDLADKCLSIFQDQGKLHLFKWISYHHYINRPEDSYVTVDKLQKTLNKYSSSILLRQGENGAPSKGGMGGILSEHPWTEVTQAKWALRRMLGDHGRDIETSIFTIADIAYSSNDAIKQLNVKGLLESDYSKKIIRPKIAYYSVQHLASVFDLFNNRIKNPQIKITTEASYSAFGYTDKNSGLQSYVLWLDEVTPTKFNATTEVNIEIKDAQLDKPVWVDLLSGRVFEIPIKSIQKNGNAFRIINFPLYDSPVLLVDRSLVQL